MSVANGVATVTEEISAYKTLGYFARLNYDYDGKYLLEVSGRYDGSSRFAPGCRWGILSFCLCRLAHESGEILGRYAGMVEQLETPRVIWFAG